MSLRKPPSLSALTLTAVTASLVVAGGGPAAAVPTAGAAPAAVETAAGRVLVRYVPGVGADAQRDLERGVRASRLAEVTGIGVHVLAVPAGAERQVVAALTRSGKVDVAELDGVAHVSRTPDDYWWPKQWSPVKVGLPAAWDTTVGSSSVQVAVLDTGVNPVADLAGKLTAGYDVVNRDTDPADDHGHGTLSAGVVGARTNNGAGVAGVCWECTVMPVKVMDASGSGTYSNIASGITWAADHGAKVISMSLSGSSDSSTLRSAVTYARNKGAVLVAAAGNDGTTTRSYPAAYDEVLGVAATDATDARASYSTYGTWVDVAAPGSNYTTSSTGGYGSFAGTSSATPVVAGLAGLLASLAPGSTPAALEEAIRATSVPVGFALKAGRIDAAAAVGAIAGAAPTATGSPSPTSSPTPAPEPEPTTTTWSGTLTKRTPSRTHAQTLPAGAVTATLTFKKAPSMTLTLHRSDGTAVTSVSGGSPAQLEVSVAAGSYSWVVSGTGGSYVLDVTGA